MLLPILIILSLFAGVEEEINLLALAFNYEPIPAEVSIENRNIIESVRIHFISLDKNIEIYIEKLDGESEDIDINLIKSVFYVLYMEEIESEQNDDFYKLFVEAFFYEDVEYEDEIMVVNDKFIDDKEIIYVNLENSLNFEITDDTKVNIEIIYDLAQNDFKGATYLGIVGEISLTGYSSPFASLNYREHISSKFGYRIDPITGQAGSFHGGLDIALPQGTPIQAVKGGEVIRSANSTGGYGKVVEIKHDDGVVTLYAHCNTLLVNRGDIVMQGQVIATVGTTGRSTGNRLHLEFKVNGQKLDPLNYLP